MLGTSLNFSQNGIIIGFSDEKIAQKLLSMGIMLGNQIKLVRKSPFGGVFYVKIDGVSIALRANELNGIEVA